MSADGRCARAQLAAGNLLWSGSNRWLVRLDSHSADAAMAPSAAGATDAGDAANAAAAAGTVAMAAAVAVARGGGDSAGDCSWPPRVAPPLQVKRKLAVSCQFECRVTTKTRPAKAVMTADCLRKLITAHSLEQRSVK